MQQLPKRGEVLTILAHGKVLTVKRNSVGRAWHAFLVRGGQTRFGNASEIRQDIEHFKCYGSLPQSKAHLWA